MRFVVDTNILVSFFRPNPVNELISKSKSLNLHLFSSQYIIDELKKNKSDVLKYSGLNEGHFNEKLSELISFLNLIPEESFKKLESSAKQISPHDKDVPVFALALFLNCSIWSNEHAFKLQSKVKVFNTRDMVEMFA